MNPIITTPTNQPPGQKEKLLFLVAMLAFNKNLPVEQIKICVDRAEHHYDITQRADDTVLIAKDAIAELTTQNIIAGLQRQAKIRRYLS